MSCDRSDTVLHGYFDNELDALSAADFERHLEQCYDCSVALGAQILTLTNASTTFSGAIAGSGGVTLTGGTETLSGTNTYTGATTITGGTLALMKQLEPIHQKLLMLAE